MSCKPDHPSRCQGSGCCTPRESYSYSVNHAPLTTLRYQVFGATGGRIFPHQWRVGAKVLEEALNRLKNAGFDNTGRFHKNNLPYNFSNFDELHTTIESIIKEIPRIGELAVYDISVCIGHHQTPVILPDEVYLHAGSRTGAERALGRKIRSGHIPVSSFSGIPALSGMSALEIEDYLCIHKDTF